MQVGRALLSVLDDDALRALGVNDAFHRARIKHSATGLVEM